MFWCHYMRTDLPATWFRLYAEFATDPKVQMLSEADQRRFLMMMCLRCCNGSVTLQDSEVAFQLRISEAEFATTKNTLLEKGLIGSDSKPTKWNERQFDSDTSNARVAKHRALHKTERKPKRNADVTLPKQESNALETETEKSNTEATASLSEKVIEIRQCPFDELISLYEKNLPTLSAVRKSLFKTGKNGDNMRQRWRWVMSSTHEKGERAGLRLASTVVEGIDWFNRYFGYVSDSEFLTGKNGKWQGCNLAWLVTSSHFEDVLSGKYHKKDLVATA